MNERERQERDEYAVGRLLDAQDEAEWEASRRNIDLGLDAGSVSSEEQRARWAVDRAAVMAGYDSADWCRWQP